VGDLADTSDLDDARYRLIFMSARIARRNGLRDQAFSLFEQAVFLAPDNEQLDASIWYILDMSLAENRDFFIRQLGKYAPLWFNGNYFNDVLERFLQVLASGHDWKRIIDVFNLLQDSKTSAKAAYAWIIARVIEEGYLTEDEMVLAVMIRSAEPSVYKRITYNALKHDVSSFLYYRLLTAEILGEPFFDVSLDVKKDTDNNLSPAQQFLLGFSANNAFEHALGFITQMEQDLTPDELRTAAFVLEQAGLYRKL
jgi:hypothetical protein